MLVADLIMPHGEKRVLGWGAAAALLGALVATVVLDLNGTAVGGGYVGDAMAIFFKQVFLAGGLLAVLGSIEGVAERFPRRQTEYYLLLLCSVLGMTLLAGTRDLILLVVAFELMGIPLYILAAYERREPLAIEGALKLFVVGAVSSAAILYGLSLLFGVAGSSDLAVIATHVASEPSALAALGGSMALAGMGFKLGVFPFHLWVPDTYQGSTTPFVAFLSTAPKAAGLVALVQVLYAGGGVLLETVAPIVVGLAAATLVAGNLLALNQDNIKRLLGYSGVAHMGFLLMALVTGSELGLAMLMFYVAAYLFTNVGAFLVVDALSRSNPADEVDTLGSFDGLFRRSGLLTWAMLAFLLSLAGIPFVVGFWAKMYVFMAAWTAGLSWLVVLGAVLSVLALFYYLRVVRAMFMNEPYTEAAVTIPAPTLVGIIACLLLVVGMGVMPGPVVELATTAAAGFVGM